MFLLASSNCCLSDSISAICVSICSRRALTVCCRVLLLMVDLPSLVSRASSCFLRCCTLSFRLAMSAMICARCLPAVSGCATATVMMFSSCLICSSPIATSPTRAKRLSRSASAWASSCLDTSSSVCWVCSLLPPQATSIHNVAAEMMRCLVFIIVLFGFDNAKIELSLFPIKTIVNRMHNCVNECRPLDLVACRNKD